MNDKYLLFSGSNYYPSGGYHDFQGLFDSLEEAKINAENEGKFDEGWAHVVYGNEIILFGELEYSWITKKFNWTWRNQE